MSYRTALIDLLSILAREGGYRAPVDQVTIAKARTLAAVKELPITTVVCNMPLCPSRLEFGGDLTPKAASLKASKMSWWTDGTKHVCVTCCTKTTTGSEAT